MGMQWTYIVAACQALPRKGSQSQGCSQGLGRSEGTPRLTQGMEQATDVQMADVQCDLQPLSERVAQPGPALQVVPTAFPAMAVVPMEVENGQPMQIDLATPRAGQAEPQGSAEAPDPAAVFACWSEETLVGAGGVPAGDANYLAPAAGPEAKDVHNTQEAFTRIAHHRWTKRRDSEFLQAEVAAAMWGLVGSHVACANR